MTQGTIKKVMEKGFGFISPAEGGKDLFFHARDLQNVAFEQVREGDQVQFDVEQGEKGPKAANIEVLS